MHKQIVFFLAISEEFLSLIPFANYPFTLYKLEIRVSQNLAKVGGGEEAHKMSGMEGEENWSKLSKFSQKWMRVNDK